MLDQSVIGSLKKIEPGLYRLRKHVAAWKFWKQRTYGYVEVSNDKSGELDFMWTSNRDYHIPHRPAKSLTIGTNIRCYMESAISFHIKWGYGRGDDSDLQNAAAYGELLASFFNSTSNKFVERVG